MIKTLFLILTLLILYLNLASSTQSSEYNNQECFSQKYTNTSLQPNPYYIQNNTHNQNPNNTPYNNFTVKGSHNSYRINYPFEKQLLFYEKLPYFAGFRNLEFDIIIDPQSMNNGKKWVFSLQHQGPFNTKAKKLDQGLQDVVKWKKNVGSHLPISIVIDIKNEGSIGDDKQFTEEINSVIFDILGKENIYTPKNLLRGHLNLQQSIKSEGYPTIKELQNKFIIILSGEDKDPKVKQRRKIYNDNIHNNAMFVDIDFRTIKYVNNLKKYVDLEPNRIIYNVNLKRNWSWQKHIKEAKNLNLLVRAYFVNSESFWDKCIELGVNILATDKGFRKKWSCF